MFVQLLGPIRRPARARRATPARQAEARSEPLETVTAPELPRPPFPSCLLFSCDSPSPSFPPCLPCLPCFPCSWFNMSVLLGGSRLALMDIWLLYRWALLQPCPSIGSLLLLRRFKTPSAYKVRAADNFVPLTRLLELRRIIQRLGTLLNLVSRDDSRQTLVFAHGGVRLVSLQLASSFARPPLTNCHPHIQSTRTTGEDPDPRLPSSTFHHVMAPHPPPVRSAPYSIWCLEPH